MKTLKKLSINPEKVIKNEELVNLRGGYDEYECVCGGDRFFAKANSCADAIQWAIQRCGDYGIICACPGL
jgi:natural product precursor